MFNFKRPESLSFPQIYRTFEVKDEKRKSIVKYRVQDLPEDRYEEAANFIAQYFIPDETLCICHDTPSKPESVAAIRQHYFNVMKEKLSVVCFKEGSSEIVGIHVLVVSSKDDKKVDAEKVSLRFLRSNIF